MFEKLELTRMAQGMAAHAGARMGVIAKNVANADTPGYKAQDIPDFASVYADPGLALKTTRAGHIADPVRPMAPAPVAKGGAWPARMMTLSFRRKDSSTAFFSHWCVVQTPSEPRVATRA